MKTTQIIGLLLAFALFSCDLFTEKDETAAYEPREAQEISLSELPPSGEITEPPPESLSDVIVLGFRGYLADQSRFEDDYEELTESESGTASSRNIASSFSQFQDLVISGIEEIFDGGAFDFAYSLTPEVFGNISLERAFVQGEGLSEIVSLFEVPAELDLPITATDGLDEIELTLDSLDLTFPTSLDGSFDGGFSFEYTTEDTFVNMLIFNLEFGAEMQASFGTTNRTLAIPQFPDFQVETTLVYPETVVGDYFFSLQFGISMNYQGEGGRLIFSLDINNDIDQSFDEEITEPLSMISSILEGQTMDLTISLYDDSDVEIFSESYGSATEFLTALMEAIDDLIASSLDLGF